MSNTPCLATPDEPDTPRPMATNLLKQLQTRFDQLPFETARIRRHMNDRHLRLGDFLQLYDALVQAKLLARPVGRALSRGDSNCYLAADGAACSWTVTAAIEDEAPIIDLKIVPPTPGGDKLEVSVAWDPETFPADDYPDTCARYLAELFAAQEAADVWQAHRHLLDLWDWNVGQPVAAIGSGLPGDGVVVRPHDEIADSWLVETPRGAFVWWQAGGMNLVTAAAGGSLPGDYLRSLFLREPSAAQ